MTDFAVRETISYRIERDQFVVYHDLLCGKEHLATEQWFDREPSDERLDACREAAKGTLADAMEKRGLQLSDLRPLELRGQSRMV